MLCFFRSGEGAGLSVSRESRQAALAKISGIEPMLPFLEACAAAISSETAKTTDALPSAQEVRDSSTLRAQELSSLTKIIAAWPKLSDGFRAAVLERFLFR
jgi:hypothetical protein